MDRVVALSLRLSPRPDGSYEGLDVQERAGREYAAHTWPGVPIEVFREKGLSAAKDDAVRPEHDRLREWVRDGRVAHVWAVEQSRFQRDEVRWFLFAAELQAAGIDQVHTRRDGVIELGSVTAGIKAVIDAAEARTLKKRVNDRLSDNAARGLPPGSRPFGYVHGQNDAGEKTYIQVPEQADVIRRAAALITAGWSLGSVAQELHDQGHTGGHGGRILAGTVKRMVTNPTVAGYRVYRGQIVGRGNWEPILDEPTWQVMKARLLGNRSVRLSNGRTYEVGDAHRSGFRSSRTARKYLLSGLAVCDVCKAPMVATLKQVRSRHVQYLVCHPNRGGRGCTGVLYDPTEAYVLDELWAELDRPEFIAAIDDDASQARREEILRALSALDAQRRELAAIWARQQLTTEEWQAARGELDDQEVQLRAELVELPARVEPVDVAEVRASWLDWTLDEQREFVGIYIAAVIVKRAVPGARAFDDARITVEWRTARR